MRALFGVLPLLTHSSGGAGDGVPPAGEAGDGLGGPAGVRPGEQHTGLSLLLRVSCSRDGTWRAQIQLWGSQGTANPLHTELRSCPGSCWAGGVGKAPKGSTWADLGEQSHKIILDTGANLASLYRLLPSLCAAVTSSEEEI